MSTPADRAARQNQQILAKIPGARSAWRLLGALRVAWRDGSRKSQAELEHTYKLPVAFDYVTSEPEKLRHGLELAMIDRVATNGRFRRVLEIGCAEGVFTEHLSSRCDTLLSVDFLNASLSRARQHVGPKANVEFGLLDIRVDPLPGDLDLICACHVLDYVRNPIALRKIRERIVSAMRPGGYLLVGFWTTDPNEGYWWSPFFLRGGKHIGEFFADHPKLTVVDSSVASHSSTYENSDLLLRKVD